MQITHPKMNKKLINKFDGRVFNWALMISHDSSLRSSCRIYVSRRDYFR